MANNSITKDYKINSFASNLGLKAKDVTDILKDRMGVEVSVQKVLEPTEFDIFFDTITKKHQIANIDDYLDGITVIPKIVVKESASKSAPAVEPVKDTSAAAQPPKEVKPAPESAKEVKQTPAPVKASAPAANTNANANPQAAARPAAPAVGNPVANAQTRPAQGQGIQGNNRPAARDGQHPNGQNAAMGNTAGAPRQTWGQNGQGQQSGQGQHTSSFQRPGANPPANGAQGQGQTRAPYGANGFNNNRPAGGNPGTVRPASFGNNANAGGQRPAGQRPGNFAGRDRDEGNSAPRETFKVQTITRGQTPKGTVNKPKNLGATRVVDTRGTDVDLSKYDDKLYNFASDAANNARGGNQKLRKQPQSSRVENTRGGKNSFVKKQAPAKQVVTLTIPDEIVVSELASRLKVTAALVCEELGANYSREVVVTIEEKLFDESVDPEDALCERAPVVCVMGHVDHGKTSILDAIRDTHVTSGEAGGITQAIGAYRVHVKGKDITFLDTPGHEAFTAMRARGAQSTDIAILVVAADDGIMPQTVEAINHAKAAGIDIIVAINKMDKPTANPDAIKQELTKYDLVPEEWGGDVMCVPVSALTHQGIDDLLEAVLLVAEVKELKANPNRRAKGVVIEAKLDKGRGPVATILVQNGTLHAGDIVIAGTSVGRVRAMNDHNHRALKEAGPSVPVEIIGLSEVPTAGDEFNAVEDERMARELADRRRNKAKEDDFKANARASLNDLFAQISEGVKDLNIIVKADVDGSVEAVRASLEKISNEEVKVRVIHAAVGGIRENDVMLAAASNAIIVGFNVRPDKAALDSAERQNVEIRTYSIIYECIEEITAAMKGMLAPKFRENLLGHVEVRQTIHVPNVGTIAGSYVLDGKVTRAAQIRVVRDGVVVFDDKISSLRRFKDDVREVAAGYECGVGLERFNDIKVGDVLEAYVMEEIAQ